MTLQGRDRIPLRFNLRLPLFGCVNIVGRGRAGAVSCSPVLTEVLRTAVRAGNVLVRDHLAFGVRVLCLLLALLAGHIPERLAIAGGTQNKTIPITATILYA